MSIDVIAEQEPEETLPEPLPFPNSRWGKWLYSAFIVVMPVIAFWATDLFKPEWQNGQFSSYLILLLFPQASLLFFVLLAYSIVSYCLLLVDPIDYSQKFVVRLGIYTGVLLAFQYTVLSSLFFFTDSSNSLSVLYLIGLWVLPLVLSKGYGFLVRKQPREKINAVLAALALGVVLISSIVFRSPMSPFVFLLAMLTLAAPFWCVLLMLRAALWLWKRQESRFTLPQGLGLAAWIAGYAAAWRFDILKMYELYAALPPQPPPDCYIATAAARGHPHLVGSWQVRRASGETMRVNRQMQILKCAELALMAVQPRFHKPLRNAYDRIGRALAGRIKHPLLADAAYVLLKPLDRVAGLLLRMLVPEIDSISKQMYTN